MSTTIHQTKSYIYIYRTTIILNTHAVLYFLTQRTQRTQSFDYADGKGFSRNTVRMEHTSEAKYVSAQSVLARLCPA